jgi:hypothetical protein
MHDTPDQVHWRAEAGECRLRKRFFESRCHDTFMQSEGVPTDRGIGVRPVKAFADRPVETGMAS